MARPEEPPGSFFAAALREAGATFPSCRPSPPRLSENLADPPPLAEGEKTSCSDREEGTGPHLRTQLRTDMQDQREKAELS